MARKLTGAGRAMRRGFTLLETMVAILLLTFTTAIFAAVYPVTSQILLAGRNCDLASDACQQQLEFWRNVGYASLPTIPTGASRISRTFAAPTSLAQGAGMVTFSRIDAGWAETTEDTGRMRVDVVITWGGRGIRGGRIPMTAVLVR